MNQKYEKNAQCNLIENSSKIEKTKQFLNHVRRVTQYELTNAKSREKSEESRNLEQNLKQQK